MSVNSVMKALSEKRAGRERCATHPTYLDGLCTPCDEQAFHQRQERAEVSDWELRVEHDCDKRFPPRFRRAVADDLQVLQWVDQMHTDPHEAPSLFLLGITGVGKTWQAYGALRAALMQPRGLSWKAITSADLVASMRPRANVDTEALLEKYRQADVLLVDDLGAMKTSEWVEEVMYRLINGRYENMKPTIFTSNLVPAELKNALGDRVGSRLTEMCTTVVLTGVDRRRAQAKSHTIPAAR